MNDTAPAAAMSAADLCRHFDSKEALTAGLVGRESERGSALATSLGGGGDGRAQLLGIVERCFLAVTRDEALMRVEIWAEASRSPALAAVVKGLGAAVDACFLDMFAELATSPD